MSTAKELITDFRGGTPSKCDFCGKETPPEKLDPEEAGEWICWDCLEKRRGLPGPVGQEPISIQPPGTVGPFDYKYRTFTNPTLELTRPVKCLLCREPMFYSGDPRCEPEMKLDAALPKWQEAAVVNGMTSPFGVETFYVHLKCWNQTVRPLKAGADPK